MKFTHFKFKNFKGIEEMTIDFRKIPQSNVYTLVGLNESGKTTILEAINYFVYKGDSLKALDLDGYTIDNIHKLIPIGKRDNFNDSILIEAGLELEENDIYVLKQKYALHDISAVSIEKEVTFTQLYNFENSEYIREKSKNTWYFKAKGKKKNEKKIRDLKNEENLKINPDIKNMIPHILYFPNFLFEFPEKIYLDETIDDKKHLFYRKVIQDILDTLQNDLKIKEHIINRVQENTDNANRNLDSVIGKMQGKLTEFIFKAWNQILGKEIQNKEIILKCGKDEKGVFISFYIKENFNLFKIEERSLGFRWFFTFLLFTQFRSYGKDRNNVLFLFDEPASNLHPSAQSELLNSFSKLKNVIYTTHSHYLINPEWLESTFIVKNEGLDYENSSDSLTKDTNIKLFNYRNFVSLHPKQVSYYQPILDVLEYSPSKIDLIENAVITEGKNDFYTLSYFKYIHSYIKDEIQIIPGTSASNLETIISLYIGWNKSFIVLLDADKEGDKQKERYKGLFGDIILDKIITYKDIDESFAKYRTEDLFSDSQKLDIIQKCYPNMTKYHKDTFNKSIQELLVNRKKIELDKSTTKNLTKVVDFLSNKLK